MKRTALGVALFLGGFGWLGGCAAPVSPPPLAAQSAALSASRAASGAAVNLQVVLRGPEGIATRAVAHRDSLPTGARVALRLTVEGPQPLWLHAYHRNPAGTLEALQPPQQRGPGEVLELPGAGLWFRLADAPGKESFYVLASPSPLGARLDAVLAALPDDREPPPLSSTSSRFPGPSYRQELGERGVATLAFTLVHAASE